MYEGGEKDGSFDEYDEYGNFSKITEHTYVGMNNDKSFNALHDKDNTRLVDRYRVDHDAMKNTGTSDAFIFDLPGINDQDLTHMTEREKKEYIELQK